MKNGVKDIVSGACLLGLVAVVGIGIALIPSTGLGGAGAKLVPAIIAAALAVLAALIIAEGRGRRGEPAGESGEKTPAHPRERLPVRLTFALLAIYVFAIEPAGFLLATFVYLTAQMYILSRFDARRLWLFIIIAGAGTTLIYWVFRTYFHVLLPQGIPG